MKINKFIVIAIAFMIFMTTVLIGGGKAYADNELPYKISVNVAKKTITIYEKDFGGEYTVSVKTMACSAYTDSMETVYNTTISEKVEWKATTEGNFVRYASVCGQNISICTAPYLEQSNGSLIAEKYNLLGSEKSDSNIWLSCSDAKWIYENCEIGTDIEIFSDDTDLDFTNKAVTIRVPTDSENSGWDPTDDAPDNPWRNENATIVGTTDINTTVGNKADLLESVKAYDICGNDITSSILIMGNYDFDRVGNYEVTYYVMDAVGSTASKNVKINVKKAQEIKADGKTGKKTNSQRFRTIIILAILSFGAAFGIIRYTKKY